MILRLEMPLIDPSLRRGRVANWHVGEGDEVAFGEDLCTVVLDEFVALRRTGRATLLSTRRRTKLKSDIEVREGKVALKIVITASEPGVVREIAADQGAPVAPGNLLAVIGSDGAESYSARDVEGACVMRVATNVAGTRDDDLEGVE